jgi:hypothetical protein
MNCWPRLKRLCRDTVSFRFPRALLAQPRPPNDAQTDDFCEVLRAGISFDEPNSNEIFTV